MTATRRSSSVLLSAASPSMLELRKFTNVGPVLYANEHINTETSPLGLYVVHACLDSFFTSAEIEHDVDHIVGKKITQAFNTHELMLIQKTMWMRTFKD